MADEQPNNTHVNPLLKSILIVPTLVVMAFIEAANGLKKTMREKCGSELGFFGALLAIAAGIATANHLYAQNSLLITIGVTVPSMVGTYFYGWPLLYLFGLYPAFRLSEELWKAVDCEKGIIWGWLSGNRKNNWLTGVLMSGASIALVLGLIYGFYFVMTAIAANFNYNGWGYILGITGGVVGFFFAAIISFAILWFGGLPIVCGVIGIGIVYYLAPWTREFVTSQGHGNEAIWGAYFLELLAWEAYVFPGVYVLISNGFRWVFDLADELKARVYDDPEPNYADFFVQVVNIATAVALAMISDQLWTMLALNPMLSTSLMVVIGLLAYIYIGERFVADGVREIGAVTTWVGGGYFIYLNYNALGIVGAITASLIAATLFYYFVFPIAYLVLRVVVNPCLVNNPLFGGSGLSELLVKLHRAVSENFRDAYDRTYLDLSEYRTLFIHLANLVIAIGVFGLTKFIVTTGTAIWMGWTLGLILMALSYLVIGRFLLRFSGIKTVSVLVCATMGAMSGSVIYATNHSILWGTILGLIIAVMVYNVAFPVTYILLKGLLNDLLKATNWLRPVFESCYAKAWKSFTGIWRSFVLTYRDLRQALAPTWQSVVASYAAAKQQVKNIWYNATGRN